MEIYFEFSNKVSLTDAVADPGFFRREGDGVSCGLPNPGFGVKGLHSFIAGFQTFNPILTLSYAFLRFNRSQADSIEVPQIKQIW